MPKQAKPLTRAETEDVVEETVSRVIGVYAEDIQSKLDTIVEGVEALGERLDRLEEQMTQVEERLERLETDMSWVKSELHEIRKELKNKVNRHEFLALEKRVAKLEHAVQ